MTTLQFLTAYGFIKYKDKLVRYHTHKGEIRCKRPDRITIMRSLLPDTDSKKLKLSSPDLPTCLAFLGPPQEDDRINLNNVMALALALDIPIHVVTHVSQDSLIINDIIFSSFVFSPDQNKLTLLPLCIVPAIASTEEGLTCGPMYQEFSTLVFKSDNISIQYNEVIDL